MTEREAREAVDIIKSECYIMNLLNLDRTRAINSALDMAVEALEQKREKGRWLNINIYNGGICSECGIQGHASYNFCPICGADMRGEDDDE